MLISAHNGHEAESTQQQVEQNRPASRNESLTNPTAVARVAAHCFRKAVKHGAKLRFAVCGPSGSGKTYTLLQLATELGGPIALLDTEHGSASKYADIFEFDVLELDSYDPLRLIELIDDAVEHQYRVLCIDSLSHFWIGKDGELEKVDRAARRMQTPNSFAAWKQVTPIHNALIDKIISAPLHILVSMRSKTEWILDRDDRTGKTVPRKVGLAPVMRDGIEYEFDVCGEMDQDNTLQVTKSRCPKLSGGVFPKPGREVADVLKEWLGTGTAPDQVCQPTSDAPVTPVEPRKGVLLVNGVGGLRAAPGLPEELASIWKRMCNPRGVVKEFVGLEAEMERLAGSTGVAEYYRILRQHGVDHPKRFKASQPARLCAKEVFGLLEELRRNAHENEAQLLLVKAGARNESQAIALEVS
jgi:hypothetical protein